MVGVDVDFVEDEGANRDVTDDDVDAADFAEDADVPDERERVDSDAGALSGRVGPDPVGNGVFSGPSSVEVETDEDSEDDHDHARCDKRPAAAAAT